MMCVKLRLFVILLTFVTGMTVASEAQTSDKPRPLLRYGNRTPRPTNFNDAALQLGTLMPEMQRVPGGHVNEVFVGSIRFGGTKVKVIIKPDDGLHTEHREDCEHHRMRASIPMFRDNRSADAAYHLNSVVQLVDTPEHIIRDDSPIDGDGTRRGGAGVQIFSSDSEDPSDTTIKELVLSEELLGELEAIAVFDCLIGNTDRHNSNWRFRTKPEPHQRHIVAIDHSLAFPVSQESGWGNYWMIESYLDSRRHGAISSETLAKLDALIGKRAEMDEILSLNLEQVAIDLLWRRVERMRREKKVFVP